MNYFDYNCATLGFMTTMPTTYLTGLKNMVFIKFKLMHKT